MIDDHHDSTERTNHMVTLNPMDSRMIAAVGYDPEQRYMLVLFNTGKAYEYYDIPPEEYNGLLTAESKGGYMREHILDLYTYAPFRGWRNRQPNAAKGD